MSEKKLENNISEIFINKMAEISAGYLSPQKFEELIKSIEKESQRRFFDRIAESNFLRILTSRFDKFAFLNDCVKYPLHIEILTAISSNSNYLTDILVRNPEFFYLISNPSTLEERLKEAKFLKSIHDLLIVYKTFESKINYLKLIKRKEILRIGVRDLLTISSLKETTEQLSILAKVISKELFDLCYDEITRKLNLGKIENSYCLIALGKLGGNELNYSSDIDFIITYDKDMKINHIEYQELLTKVIYLFIESASMITSEGYIYRVDFRLRPDGRNSPLCASAKFYLDYYESRGEDWERQMLIKASFAAGSIELYNKFMNYLTPFIYPVSFLTSPLEQINKLKTNIENNLKGDENIKLSSGGIRDIEFSIQALQLLNGGRFAELRTPNTLNGIKKLVEFNLLKEEEAKLLSDSYIFYRKIEHFLQLMNDRQTHSIPAKGEMLDRLSSFLNFTNSEDFQKDLQKRKREIRKIFTLITKTKEKKSISKSEDGIKFENRTRTNKNLEFLRTGKGLLEQKYFDQKSIIEFQNIEDNIIEYLKKSINPDKVLDNFVRFIKFDTLISIWYKEFRDEKFLKSFLHLCEFSQKVINLFSEDEELREQFLSRAVFEKLDKKVIREFSIKKLIFHLAVQFSLKLLPLDEMSGLLTSFCSQKINELTKVTLHGESAQSNVNNNEYFIAGMGSFASSEMTFFSDIDLIFIIKNEVDLNDIQKRFQDLLNQLQITFKPLQVDCRLRPEGKSSPLAWGIESYKSYINNRARIWEFQSYTKLNFICGSREMFDELTDVVNKKVSSMEGDNVNKELIGMRNKLYPKDYSSIAKIFNVKKSRGGIADIEFIIQKILLTNVNMFEKLAGKSTIEKINSISEEKKFADIKELKENFIFFKKLEVYNQLIFDSKNPSLKNDRKTNLLISHEMEFKETKEFEDYLNSVIKFNINSFNKFFN
jgi:[glutamine synthetase] adenylyltransferase / [glutamine synthetase]-adenylyl-L-tyrosine phosphorylase